jgi:hypothetical protein
MFYPLGVFLSVRLFSLIAVPYEAVLGYGDYLHFFELAQFAIDGVGGLPYLQHWIEFPPVFPYFSILLYLISGGVEHVYAYLLAISMLLLNLGCLWLFLILGRWAVGMNWAEKIGWLYTGFLLIPAFSWWTFEPMAVFTLLFSLAGIFAYKPVLAGLSAGLGILVKVLPGFSLIVAWRYRPRAKWLLTTISALVLVGLVIGWFYLSEPDLTIASLLSQSSKGSWETVWALIDGNFGTGNFGALSEYLKPEYAFQLRGNPSVIPHWIPTLIFLFLLIWVYFRSDRSDDRKAIPLLGLIFTLTFLWTRGWSPQWIAYLIPFILLSFPLSTSITFSMTLIATTLLEWPVLLSRGRFDLLWLPVLLRTAIFILLSLEFGKRSLRIRNPFRSRGKLPP